jgi:hypothetical protein
MMVVVSSNGVSRQDSDGTASVRESDTVMGARLALANTG